ncbi:hypothetical protein [Novipirellula rosea]|uniref:Translation elongation factor EFTu/EF1A C-terminal domain-containing protein n=1 Tax=Novipirellula rosea TaxID=1031540 RepID=A0ABP8MTQ5_9BACT|tara:strand:+ start:17054 stop:17239 length:186 start_codon:yes stop_codon:yes gene_type:complete
MNMFTAFTTSTSNSSFDGEGGKGVRLSIASKQPVAISDGDHFAIREGGKTVGSGVVTRVVA